MAVIVYIKGTQGKRGHDRVTINESVCEKIEVQRKIMELGTEAYNERGNPEKKWNRSMAMIKDYLVKETARERKKQVPRILQLRQMLTVLNKKVDKGGSTPQLLTLRTTTTRELKELENPELARSADTREAIKNTEKSDNSTKSYFRSYKDAAKQQWINGVKTTDEWKEGTEPTFTGKTTTAKEVPKELRKFYKMLYAHKKINSQDAEDIFKKFDEKKLTSPSMTELEKEITEEEIIAVMENLPLGKQAGPDRIPNAVFKYLPKFFAPKLKRLIQYSMTRGRLPKSMLQGDISLLYKKKRT